MRISEVAFEIERVVQARGRDGRSTEIETIGIELGDSHTIVAYVFFLDDEEPLVLLVDSATPVSERTLDRAALKQALLGSSPAAVSFMH